MGCVCILLSGCTSKEQDQKIRAFWFQQFWGVVQKKGSLKNSPATMLPMSFAASAAARPTVPTHTESSAVPVVTHAPAPVAPRVTTPAVSRPATILDVTMDDEALPGKAPLEDRVRMKRDWTALQVNNQVTLKDLQVAFGDKVKDKAFYMMLSTEQKLKQVAYLAPDYTTYQNRQQQLLQEQSKAISQLMEQNKASIRHFK